MIKFKINRLSRWKISTKSIGGWEELKPLVAAKVRKRNVFLDPDSWKLHQELQNHFKTLIVSHTDYALDKKAEMDLWNFCFKDVISELQKAAADRAATHKKRASEAKYTLNSVLEIASGFYVALLGELEAAFRPRMAFLQVWCHARPSVEAGL